MTLAIFSFNTSCSLFLFSTMVTTIALDRMISVGACSTLVSIVINSFSTISIGIGSKWICLGVRAYLGIDCGMLWTKGVDDLSLDIWPN